MNTEKITDDICFICCDKNNEVYLKPCRHTGFCKDCFLDYIKTKDICPYCKKTIQQAYVYVYDEISK